jgi:hypothetical protein
LCRGKNRKEEEKRRGEKKKGRRGDLIWGTSCEIRKLTR